MDFANHHAIEKLIDWYAVYADKYDFQAIAAH